jgi:type III secretion system FlhB-like substrate exporter
VRSRESNESISVIAGPRNRRAACSLVEHPRRRASVRAPEELAAALQSDKSERVGAIVPLGDQLFFAMRVEIARFAREHRMATMYDLRPYVVAGGLLSYGPKILRGANPAELPVEQPNKFVLVLNLETARALGITIPDSIALQVTELLRASASREARQAPGPRAASPGARSVDR